MCLARFRSCVDAGRPGCRHIFGALLRSNRNGVLSRVLALPIQVSLFPTLRLARNGVTGRPNGSGGTRSDCTRPAHIVSSMHARDITVRLERLGSPLRLEQEEPPARRQPRPQAPPSSLMRPPHHLRQQPYSRQKRHGHVAPRARSVRRRPTNSLLLQLPRASRPR